MEVIIDKTGNEYYFQTEFLTREAFWNVYKPGCDEHLVLHNLRNSPGHIAALDLIAILGQEIIGHIISTKARVIDSSNNEHEILCVGPVSVLPSFQKKGIGAELMNYSITEARRLGYPGMILFGNPAYYQRFGFKNAKEYAITTRDLQNFDPFMVLELIENGLASVQGRFFEEEAFAVDPEALEEFEKKFPYKKKFRTATQFQ